jgi:hypothetical protein
VREERPKLCGNTKRETLSSFWEQQAGLAGHGGHEQLSTSDLDLRKGFTL